MNRELSPGGCQTTLSQVESGCFEAVDDVSFSARGPDPAEFAAAVLRMDIEHYRHPSTEAELVFFDRAIPDALCFLHDLDLLSLAEAEEYLSDFPYFHQVFVPPPWEAIYTTDTERDQTFAEAVRVHRRASDWYSTLGYELVELPLASIDERCEFMLQRLRVS
jgi:predicted ATPase